MAQPYRVMDRPPEPPRAPRFALALLLAGAFGIAPVGACSGLAAVMARLDARASLLDRTPDALVVDPPEERAPVRLHVTPQTSRLVPVRTRDGDEGHLLAIAESRRIVIFARERDLTALTGSSPTDLVVHRSRAYLGDDSYFGVNARELQLYMLEDPRVEAAQRARIAGITSIAGFSAACLAFLTLRLRRRTAKE